MNENLRAKAGLIYNVVEAVILAMAVLLNVWNSKMAISHGEKLAADEATTKGIDTRVTSLENTGSKPLVAHEQKDDERVKGLDNRVSKLESAVIVLQAMPGELKAIGVSLQNLTEGQKRIEDRLDKK